MSSHGRGYCTSGYYGGWDKKGISSQEACNAVCMAESKCTFAAFYKGQTCSRYHEATCTLNKDTKHFTFKKNIKKEEKPKTACKSADYKFKEAGPVLNYGKDCWNGCRSVQGPCKWCGSGTCCRVGWHDKKNGCDGTVGIKGKRQHMCVPNPKNACTDDCQCDGNRTCSKDKKCVGVARPPVQHAPSKCTIRDDSIPATMVIG
jgi:hypothetical protein